jgi:hypothetical protein
MLDREPHQEAVVDWAPAIQCDVQLPEAWKDYFQKVGPLPTSLSDHRRAARFQFRRGLVLAWRGGACVVYGKDVSRVGVAFLHSDQLFPGEACSLWVSRQKRLELVVARCRRVNERCYECGANFATEKELEAGRKLAARIPM